MRKEKRTCNYPLSFLNYTALKKLYDDMLKYDYNSIFDFSTIFNIVFTNREGFLIRYSEENEWVFLKMIYLDDELSANDVNIHILEIYRNKVTQPLKDDYFKNPPKTRLIFQRIIEL